MTSPAMAVLTAVTYRVINWPDDMRVFYADHWYALVLPVTAFRLLFFLPIWTILIVIAICNTIPIHIDIIRHGR